MDLRDKLKNKLKNTGIETRDKNLTKAKKRLVSGILDVDKQQKLKVSKSDKIIVTDNTSKKINEQKTTSKSFSTPLSKSQVDNFVNEVKSSSLDSPSSIGRGGSSDVRDFLESERNSSLDNLVDKAKDQALQEVNHLIDRKISKGQKYVTGLVNSIYNGGKDIPRRPNIGNNPYRNKALNAYESKAEVLSFGDLKGQPSITFKVAGTDKPNTKQMFEGGGTGTTSQKNKIIKSTNLPAVAGSLNTGYVFNYETKDKPFVEGAATTILRTFGESRTGQGVLQSNNVAINPNQEQVFTSVDFRALTFEYVFLPKNERESELIDDIIFMFKYWSHPSETTLDARSSKINFKNDLEREAFQKISSAAKYVKLLNYPSMWEISYNDGVGGSSGVDFKTKKCYCTKIDVSYGSAEGLLLFEDTNKPTLIRLSMSFVESEYILRQDIDGGF